MSDIPSDEPTAQERRALFRVVRGEPTDAELAALAVVLAGTVAGAGAATPRTATRPVTPSAWNDPAARLRRPVAAGPGAWRASTWPR